MFLLKATKFKADEHKMTPQVESKRSDENREEDEKEALALEPKIMEAIKRVSALCFVFCGRIFQNNIYTSQVLTRQIVGNTLQ